MQAVVLLTDAQVPAALPLKPLVQVLHWTENEHRNRNDCGSAHSRERRRLTLQTASQKGEGERPGQTSRSISTTQ
jgi:hypothetical protein